MAYSDQSRDAEQNERMRENLYGTTDPYNADQNAPSGRSIAIMFGAIIAIFLLIALFSWSSGGPEATTGAATGADQSPATEQSAPAPEPAAPAQ